jgi:hypothetical protein
MGGPLERVSKALRSHAARFIVRWLTESLGIRDAMPQRSNEHAFANEAKQRPDAATTPHGPRVLLRHSRWFRRYLPILAVHGAGAFRVKQISQGELVADLRIFRLLVLLRYSNVRTSLTALALLVMLPTIPEIIAPEV